MGDAARKWWALAAIGSGVLLSTIDASIVNIATNTFVEVFDSNLNVVEWVLLSYLLTLTCLLLMMGRLGDMIGKRRVYVAGFVLFTVASALCGLAPSIGALIGFRVLQAVGAAMIQAVGPALLVMVFPREQRGTALGAVGSFVAVGILIGPALGGILLRYVGWESIFYVNVPIGIIGVWLSLRSLPADSVARGDQRFDYVGAGLLAVSLFGLLLGLTEGPHWGWFDLRVLGLFALATATGIAFVVWERRATQPMVRLSIFRRPAFSFNLLAGLILFCGLSFNLLLTPLFLQLVFRFDLQTTGLVLMSLPIALSVTSPLSGRLSDRIGSQVLTIVGLVCTSLGLFGLSTMRVDTPLPLMIALLVLVGIGVGLFQSPNNSTVLGNAPPEALGVASSLLAVVRTLGNTAGIALAGAVWSSSVFAILGAPIDPVTSAPPDVLAGGFDIAMRVAAGFALLAIVPSLFGGRAARATRPKTHNELLKSAPGSSSE